MNPATQGIRASTSPAAGPVTVVLTVPPWLAWLPPCRAARRRRARPAVVMRQAGLAGREVAAVYIPRQNMAVHYEAPFMFLLFGGSRALLLDTGVTPDPRFFPLRRTVDAIIDGWLASQHHRGDYGLLVLHTGSPSGARGGRLDTCSAAISR